MMQVSFVPILLWVAALGCAGVAIWRGPRPIARGFVIDRLLRYLFVFPLGLQGYGPLSAMCSSPRNQRPRSAGRRARSNTRWAFANLGLGLASLYAAFRGFEARLAVAIAAACFLGGAGIGHIRNIIEAGNFAPGNAGPIMATDFLTPIAVLVLSSSRVEGGGRNRWQRLR
jgi:hypothetical protein